MTVISVSLPSDGTTGTVSQYNTPITTIVNDINGGLDNTNIATGAAIATSKLASDNGITASMISSSAITLGYAQITANVTTTSTTFVQATGLTVTVTIPSGTRRIKITVVATGFGQTTASGAAASIWDGVVGSGTQIGQFNMIPSTSGAANAGMCMIAVPTAPAAGSKTYNVGIEVVTSGTASIFATTVGPAFILVEAI